MLNAGNCMLQLAAASNMGSKASPVMIRLNDGSVHEIDSIVWDEDTSSVIVIEEPAPPAPTNPPEV